MNKFGAIIGFAHAGMTAEGDNRVLMQKVAKEYLSTLEQPQVRDRLRTGAHPPHLSGEPTGSPMLLLVSHLLSGKTLGRAIEGACEAKRLEVTTDYAEKKAVPASDYCACQSLCWCICWESNKQEQHRGQMPALHAAFLLVKILRPLQRISWGHCILRPVSLHWGREEGPSCSRCAMQYA